MLHFKARNFIKRDNNVTTIEFVNTLVRQIRLVCAPFHQLQTTLPLGNIVYSSVWNLLYSADITQFSWNHGGCSTTDSRWGFACTQEHLWNAFGKCPPRAQPFKYSNQVEKDEAAKFLLNVFFLQRSVETTRHFHPIGAGECHHS